MEEEIDLRPYVEAIGRNWKWIIAAGILTALIALLITFFITPTYQATALVAITEPRQVVQFDPRIRTTEDSQPVEAYPELATSDELLSVMLQEVSAIDPTIDSLAKLRGLLSSRSISDAALLNLSVTHNDPQLAANMANLWAELFVTKINEVFGNQGDEQLSFFEDQLAAASQELQQVEQELADFQARNRSAILENELLALQQAQADQLAMQRQIGLLFQETESLRSQLTTAESGDKLYAADQLSAILLQLRAFSGVSNPEVSTPWQLQVSLDQLERSDRLEQLAFLEQLQGTLNAQVQLIDVQLAELEPQILSLQQEKQKVDAEGANINREFVVAEETYTTLARKVDEERITSQNTGSGVRLASRSAVPEVPNGPRRLVITAAAGFLGAVLATAIVLLKFVRGSAKESL